MPDDSQAVGMFSSYSEGSEVVLDTKRHAALAVVLPIYAGCGSGVATRDLDDAIIHEGITCENAQRVDALGDAERIALRNDLVEAIGLDGLAARIQNREPCPSSTEMHTLTTGSIKQSITSEFIGEWIEGGDGTGGVSGFVYRDSQSSGWMCNDGNRETPADFLVEYRVAGAFQNHDRLRVKGTNPFASCYITLGGPSAARVYTDDDVRMCVGFWRAFVCALAPTRWDTAMWVD